MRAPLPTGGHRWAGPVRLLSAALLCCGCGGGDGITCPGPPTSPCALAFLDTLGQRTFAFFWERTSTTTGLTPDRWPTPSASSIAGVGFALSALPIGVERGWVSRAAAAERARTTLQFLWTRPQGPGASGTAGYQGFFYHFLDVSTGLRDGTSELSTIDTSLLLGGVLYCREYFDGADATETAVRAYADSLYQRVNWQWAEVRPPAVVMAWTPETGFMDADWHGYNEAMILYLLALGSPTYPVPPDAWDAWTSGYRWGRFYGYDHIGFAPLFGHFFSHVWVDFRDIRDAWTAGRGIDYFENSRRAAAAQQAYAVANPRGWQGYGADAWGLTASDGPADVEHDYAGQRRRFFTYYPRGASFTETWDDGTISPSAAGGVIPFTPDSAIHALLAMRQRYGEPLFGTYGFLDAFNPTFQWQDVPLWRGRIVPGLGWFDTDYIAIDQGPILTMIANYRWDLVWRYMRKSPYIVEGLRRAGFRGGWLDQAQ